MESNINRYIEIENEHGEIVYYDNPEFVKLQIEKKYDIYFKNSGIPETYRDISFDDYVGGKSSEAYQSILRYAENINTFKYDNCNLYLFGRVSTQKTTLGINILKSAMRQGLRCKFILAGHLINKLMKLQAFNVDDSIQREVDDLKSVDVLMIDDIFDPAKTLQWKGESNNLIVSEWDSFFRDRLSRNKKIILTSNFSMEIVEKNYSSFLYELLYRNFKEIELTESVREIRKLEIKKMFEEN